MKASAQLDDLIAEKVFGYRVEHGTLLYCGDCYPWTDYYLESGLCQKIDPSQCIQDAWMVVQAMEERGWGFMILRGKGFTWNATFGRKYQTAWAEGETAAEAICLAALNAVEKEL